MFCNVDTNSNSSCNIHVPYHDILPQTQLYPPQVKKLSLLSLIIIAIKYLPSLLSGVLATLQSKSKRNKYNTASLQSFSISVCLFHTILSSFRHQKLDTFIARGSRGCCDHYSRQKNPSNQETRATISNRIRVHGTLCTEIKEAEG